MSHERTDGGRVSGLAARVDPEVRRVLGFAQGSVRLPALGGAPWVRHLVRWARWRRLVRDEGPYAPSFEEFIGGDRPSR